MTRTRLMVADSEHDANMLYATGLFVPDPFIFIETRGRKYIVVSDLEIDRARRQADVHRVLSFSSYQARLKRAGVRNVQLAEVLNAVLRDLRLQTVEVPANFPLGLARKLRGVRVAVKGDPFFREREIKSAAEVRKLTAALRLAEQGMQAALDVLRMSRIGRDGFLRWRGNKLTSEHVQGVINATIAGLGGSANHTIVACGNQGCDPHESGHGPLRAHQPIILDIFPRDSATGYWGDLTRTVVRGRASDRIKRMYRAVHAAQKFAFTKLRAGINGRDVHEGIQKLFREHGFVSGKRNGRMQGFFHGTGHGLGLEIHERPRVGSVDEKLQDGQVVTVEPGLYYWGVGGVRLEDVAVIGKRGAKNLTRCPKVLELPA
jgi:Xaa-Pro aminopeptidase